MKHSAPVGYRALLVAIGAHGMVVQLVLLREFLAAFSGNELVAGLLLAFWMGCEAFGGYWLGRTISGRRTPGIRGNPEITGSANLGHELHSLLHMVPPAALVSAAAVPAVALGRALFRALPGESVGPAVLAAVAGLSVALPGLAHGAMFVLGTGLLAYGSGQMSDISHRMPDSAQKRRAVGQGYFWEGLGTVLAAVAAGLFLLARVGPVSLAAWSGVLLCAGVAIVSDRRLPALAVLPALVLLASFGRAVEGKVWEQVWPGQRVVGISESPYGKILSMEREGQALVAYNGTLVFSSVSVAPDLDEQMVVVPLMCHPQPRKVLIVGANLGLIAPVLRQPVDEVTFVQMDRQLCEAEKRAARAELVEALADSRLAIRVADPRQFLAASGRGSHRSQVTGYRAGAERQKAGIAGAERYDCIILADALPLSLGASRLFTVEFFRLCRERLGPGGVLAAVGPAGATAGTRAELLVRDAGLRSVFPEVELLLLDFPLWVCGTGQVDVSAEILAGRLEARQGSDQGAAKVAGTLSADYLRALLDRFRQEQYKRSLSLRGSAARSTDLRPAELFFALVRDSRATSAALSKLYSWVGKIRAGHLAIFAAALLALLFVLGRRFGSGFGFRAGVATSGFAGSGLTILAVFAFQVRFGSVYLAVSLLLAGFLAGTVLGGWCGTVLAAGTVPRRKLFLAADLCVAVCGPLLLLLFRQASGGALFFLLLAAAGFAVGMQFPLAGAEDVAKSRPAATAAGGLLALDLAGGAKGALAVSLVLVPILGIPGAVGAILALKLVGMAAQAGAGRREIDRAGRSA